MKNRFVLTIAAAVLVALVYSCCSVRPPPPLGVGQRYVMEVTGYCKCGKCCGWRRNWYGRPVYAYGPREGKPKKVGICADGSRAAYGTIAADGKHWSFGTRMYVPGYGYGVVRDRGGAIQGPYRLDLYFDSHEEALAWGRRRVIVTVLPR